MLTTRCASLLVELDTHPQVAMQILRHPKIATTMDIYTYVPNRAALPVVVLQVTAKVAAPAGGAARASRG